MKNTANSPMLNILTEHIGAARPSDRKQSRLHRHATSASLQETGLHSLAQSIEELLEPTVVPEEPTLTWEEREATGEAELLRIYMDALNRPMSEAEFARSEQIVRELNASRPT